MATYASKLTSSALTNLSTIITDFDNEIAAKDKEINKLTADLINAQTDVANLNTTLTNATVDNSLLSNDLKNAQAEIIKLQSALSGCSTRYLDPIDLANDKQDVQIKKISKSSGRDEKLIERIAIGHNELFQKIAARYVKP